MPPLTPTREAGLERLAQFVPKSGSAYASGRNYDHGAGAHTRVSMLSPYLRRRLVLEREVLAAVLDRYAPSTADKFISEVYWRTYFKGFLERTPSVWTRYRATVDALQEDLDKDRALRADHEAACEGRTGIDAFDHWALELVDTGYLHNHARMWFASIWIFTLRLPWELGADFFLRHLMDGDPASNTLSWRWVGGLHTKGRTYLARPDNIAKYTEGRFRPTGLAREAPALEEHEDHLRRPAPEGDPPPDGPALLLVTEEDLAPETLLPAPGAAVRTNALDALSPRPLGAVARAFAEGALHDGAARNGEAPAVAFTADALAEAADRAGLRAIATPYCPVGPAADALAAARAPLAERGIRLHAVLREEDARAWPYADKGFFKVKKAIPKLLAA